MSNYSVVIFKNRTLKKILKEFVTFKKAKKFFDEAKKDSDNVLFEVIYENGNQCRYELALIENSNSKLIPVYLTDEMGRNKKVKLEQSGKTISEITLYRKEESFFDIGAEEKITTDRLIKKYLRTEGVKVISSLNNKLIIQNEDDYKIFSFKNEVEVLRFLDFLTLFFQKNKRKDCLIVKDTSVAQKKYLLKILSDNGFDKKFLYRKTTTHPRKV